MPKEVEKAMRTLVRTELLAMRTIGTTWALVVAAVLLTAGLTVNPVLNAGRAGQPSIGTAGALLAVLGGAGRGALVMLLLGVLTVTAEFRHGTLTATLLHTPQRSRVLTAKGTATAAVAAAVAVADLAVVLAVGLTTGAVQPALLNADIALHVLGLLLAYPLYGLAGVGIGALLMYQPVAVLLPLAWAFVVENLVLRLLPPSAPRWSLGGASAALANAGDFPAVLPMAVGGIVLLSYALLLLGFGALRLARRDIT
jgi:ABC-2 type transport system permease protein